MDTSTFSRFVIAVLSIPLLIVVEVFRKFDLLGFHNDLNTCLIACKLNSSSHISDDLFRIVIIAEDRRNSFHWGVDPISIARAVVKFLFFRRIEGASTIEQQFVRVVTGRYQRTIRRKLREQILAIALGQLISKRAIATAYIHIAFYGKDIESILQRMNSTLKTLSLAKSAELVARLKYPEPSFIDPEWRIRYERRLVYIERLLVRKTAEEHMISLSILTSH